MSNTVPQVVFIVRCPVRWRALIGGHCHQPVHGSSLKQSCEPRWAIQNANNASNGMMKPTCAELILLNIDAQDKLRNIQQTSQRIAPVPFNVILLSRVSGGLIKVFQAHSFLCTKCLTIF